MSNQQTVQQVLLFGASNLTLGWNAVISELTAFWKCPLNVNVCLGMGRSWIGTSRVFWRVLPGITECGLWNRLPDDSERVSVMLTDIGNDIVYGYSPQQILDSVRLCLDRIRNWAPDCQIIVTRLPIASIRTLGEFRFRVMRFILFPGNIAHSRRFSPIQSRLINAVGRIRMVFIGESPFLWRCAGADSPKAFRELRMAMSYLPW